MDASKLHHRRRKTTVSRATRIIWMGFPIFNWPACCIAAGCSPGGTRKYMGNVHNNQIKSAHAAGRSHLLVHRIGGAWVGVHMQCTGRETRAISEYVPLRM